jgi:hypothetical protein
MQFSKYGQEHQPNTPPTDPDPPQRENTPLQQTHHNGLVKAGPSHTTTPTTTRKGRSQHSK